jgi:uncharacterized protein (DUF1015 family)
MPQFIPLQFYHYNWLDRRISPEKVISPPYDVLSPDDKKALAREEFNVVHLDSPASYQEAAIKLNSWILDNILSQDPFPCFYIMATDYKTGNATKTRWGFYGGMRVHPFEDKKVFPHEQTYSKAKNDRLQLMMATHGQLSPIFGIYDDSELILENIGRQNLETPPIISFYQEPDVVNRIWPVPVHHNQSIEELILNKKVFIADGHHRYETALNYKSMMPNSQNAPWNHVFVYLSNISSPGLEIFPYHRIISRKKTFDWNRIIKKAESDFNISCSDKLAQFSGQWRADSFALYTDKKFVLFTPKTPPRDIFSRIGAHVLDKMFLRGPMELSDQDLASGEFISYTHEQEVIFSKVDSGDAQAGFILRPVPMDVLQKVCETGNVMPRKSTFFYPKLPTGVLFHLWGDRTLSLDE